MKPANLKETRKSRATARVKMLMRAHLYWLSGFPQIESGELSWISPQLKDVDKRKICLAPMHISKAVRTVHELLREYPKALPEVIGDTDKWKERTLKYLDYAKRLQSDCATGDFAIFSLFEQDPSFQRECKSFHTAADAELKNLQCALSWMHYIDRSPLKLSMAALVEQAAVLAGINKQNELLAINCIRLLSLDTGRSVDLVKLVANSLTSDTVTRHVSHDIKPFTTLKFDTKKQKKKRVLTPLVFKPDMTSKEISSFVDWLITLKPDRRRTALDVLNILRLCDLYHAWANWWRVATPLLDKIISNVNFVSKDKHASIYRMQGDLARHLMRQPLPVDLPAVFNAIRCLSLNKNSCVSIAPIVELYTSFVPKTHSGLAMLHHVHSIWHHYRMNQKSLEAYLKSFRRFLTRCEKKTWVGPWRDLSYFWSTPESDILHILHPKQYALFFNTLAAVNQSAFRPINSNEMQGFAYLVVHAKDSTHLSKLVVALLDYGVLADIDDSLSVILNGLELEPDQAKSIVQLYEKLDNSLRDEHVLLSCFKSLQMIGHANLLLRVIALDMVSVMMDISYKLNVIERTNGSLVCFPKIDESLSPQPWMLNYPESLLPALCQLAQFVKNPEARIRKMAAGIWMPKSYLEASKTLLQAQIEASTAEKQPILERKLAKLSKNIATHQPITPGQLAKFELKLTHLIEVTRLKIWHQAIDRQFQTQWTGFFGIDLSSAPAWLFEPERMSQLLPIVDLDKIDKKLAIEVICARAEDKHEEFRHAPQNAYFVSRMEEKGLDMMRWLSGPGKQKYNLGQDSELSIEMAQDPLEILNMGGYFKTCLSPGHFNFFSVFSNIVDVNKQVLYGKNHAGQVVGRVLCGMTDAGGIQVFNCYSHSKKYGFAEHVLTYIRDWSAAIGTVLVEQGEVSKLVARHWYDDGAIDVGTGIACFAEDSSLRKKIKALPADQVISEVRQQLLPLPLNDLTFPMLVQMKEVRKRKDLVPGLVEVAVDIPDLNEACIVQLFKMAYKHDLAAMCYRPFKKVLLTAFEKEIIDYEYIDSKLGEGLLACDPSIILKSYRKFRKLKHAFVPQDMKNLVISALERLGRPKQAERLQKGNL